MLQTARRLLGCDGYAIPEEDLLIWLMARKRSRAIALQLRTNEARKRTEPCSLWSANDFTHTIDQSLLYRFDCRRWACKD